MKTRYDIDGKYDCKANWVIMKRKKDKIIAHNCLTDEDLTLTNRKACYLHRLDGHTHPLKVKGFSYNECKRYYKELDSELLIREGRNADFDRYKIHTIYIPSKMRTRSIIPKILNFLLMILCVPVFVNGLCGFVNRGIHYINDQHDMLGWVVGIPLGVILHELAHAVACLACGGRWIEAGVMWCGFCPGAYCLIDDDTVKGKYRQLKRVQINLAGVEMNLLLAGISFLLITYSQSISFIKPWTGMLVMIAAQNIVLPLLNLIFTEGLDGEHVISILLGTDSVVDQAKADLKCMLKQKERRRYFKKNGINGVANICTSCVIMMFQITTPLVILAEVMYVIGVIFLE